MRTLLFLALLIPSVLARDRGGPLGVSAGSLGSCARFGGRAVCWGRGNFPFFGASPGSTPPVGDGADEILDQPEILWQTTDKLAYMQTEYLHRCALFENGKIRCMSYEGERCGLDTTAQVGGAAPDFYASVPFVAFHPTAPPVQQLSTGYNHNCALFEDGGIRCWGITCVVYI
jgi:hypothetical protein